MPMPSDIDADLTTATTEIHVKLASYPKSGMSILFAICTTVLAGIRRLPAARKHSVVVDVTSLAVADGVA